ncbi:MAG TPA: succinate dehydrogenase cytochrome b subunit [Bacteroidetes bacterium]|nr:succinate dehydrogenase cytochrome b subunit [Bacteroidota bacterium]
MSTLTKAFSYSVGKKLIMGLTGFFLITFLIEHVIGNFLMFGGPEPFNAYAEFMGHTWFIRIAEVILFLGFIIHIYDGLSISLQNSKARPVGYAVKAGSKNSNWFSRNMKWTGTILLVFLILHLVSFFMTARFGLDIGMGIDMSMFPYDTISYTSDGITEHSLWHKAAAQFSVEWYSAIYVLAMVVVAFHLLHGFQSAFQTLGIKHPKYAGMIEKAGLGFAILAPAALASVPIYFVILKHSGELATFFIGSFGF